MEDTFWTVVDGPFLDDDVTADLLLLAIVASLGVFLFVFFLDNVSSWIGLCDDDIADLTLLGGDTSMAVCDFAPC